jgi:hypothetical protein
MKYLIALLSVSGLLFFAAPGFGEGTGNNHGLIATNLPAASSGAVKKTICDPYNPTGPECC